MCPTTRSKLAAEFAKAHTRRLSSIEGGSTSVDSTDVGVRLAHARAVRELKVQLRVVAQREARDLLRRAATQREGSALEAHLAPHRRRLLRAARLQCLVDRPKTGDRWAGPSTLRPNLQVPYVQLVVHLHSEIPTRRAPSYARERSSYVADAPPSSSTTKESTARTTGRNRPLRPIFFS